MTDQRISAREGEVLAALGEHLTNAEIGARLFISIRTVESHVSSLLRKLQVADRRALAGLAGTLGRPKLPEPLTPFVGRATERAELMAALENNRLVTAIGPGGVGKTRLALNVAVDAGERFADGVWYVDLVPVTDPLMIARAIADGLGLGERQGSSAADDVARWLSDRAALLVFDNCEHLLDGVVVLLERLLRESPGLVVLATSRARLLVPFERVFLVPGLSVDSAVELFLGRVGAGGSLVQPTERPRVAALCRSLDGMALAIELAAARYASLGLDGLESGLADRLHLLTGGPRIDDRHRSLRSTLDWSYALLADSDQAVLRRVSVFASPFTAQAAAEVLDLPSVPTVLASLADQSLLIAHSDGDGTRYRALESIRQYGAEQLSPSESDDTRSRHLQWCLHSCENLKQQSWTAEARKAFDMVADELRGALALVADPDPEGARLATSLADLLFLRGLPGEAQRRYEQAATLSSDAAPSLRLAAGAAESRHFGAEAVRLRLLAGETALSAGDSVGAARDFARTAELVKRAPGLMATVPPAGLASSLIARARALASGDIAAQAWVQVAEACDEPASDPLTLAAIDRGRALAREAGDPLAESAALDGLTSARLAVGDLPGAVASASMRLAVLESLPVTAAAGLEMFDSTVMAAECAVAAGDFAAARSAAERLRDLPFYREEGHLAAGRLLLVTMLTGEWAEAVPLAMRFREGWERAGRPRAGNLTRGAYAAATMFGMRGDFEARSQWLSIVRDLRTPGRTTELHYTEFFEALLLLHQGSPVSALSVLAAEPESFTQWYDGMWKPWYAAMWAEAGVLCGVPDRLPRAFAAAAGNPIALVLVSRAAALADGDRDGLAAAAASLLEAGCHYQWARTLVMMRDPRGAAWLASVGAAPMTFPTAVPPGSC